MKLTYKEIEVEVELEECLPAERETREYPGYPAVIELTSVKVNDVDIMLLMSVDALIEIEELARKMV